MKFSRYATIHLLLRPIPRFFPPFFSFLPSFLPSFLSARSFAFELERSNHEEKKSFPSENLSLVLGSPQARFNLSEQVFPQECIVLCPPGIWTFPLFAIVANEGRPFPVIISRGRTFAFLFSRYRGPVNIRLLFNVYLYLCVRPLGGIEGEEGGGRRKIVNTEATWITIINAWSWLVHDSWRRWGKVGRKGEVNCVNDDFPRRGGI